MESWTKSSTDGRQNIAKINPRKPEAVVPEITNSLHTRQIAVLFAVLTTKRTIAAKRRANFAKKATGNAASMQTIVARNTADMENLAVVKVMRIARQRESIAMSIRP